MCPETERVSRGASALSAEGRSGESPCSRAAPGAPRVSLLTREALAADSVLPPPTIDDWLAVNGGTAVAYQTGKVVPLRADGDRVSVLLRRSTSRWRWPRTARGSPSQSGRNYPHQWYGPNRRMYPDINALENAAGGRSVSRRARDHSTRYGVWHRLHAPSRALYLAPYVFGSFDFTADIIASTWLRQS